MIPLHILGDPHLGRRFQTGVPLHRLGEREAMQWQHFVRELSPLHDGELVHVCMGDLFDRTTVSNRLVLDVFEAYQTAARRSMSTTFVVLQGNHDASRDRTVASSFDLFTKLVRSSWLDEHVIIVDDQPFFESYWGFGFVPWHPFRTAREQVQFLIDSLAGRRLEAVFGHWDVEAFGDDSNLVPTDLLSLVTDRVFTGHIHLPGQFRRHGVDVTVTGSMEPYSHAEDPNGVLYRTMSLQELLEMQSSCPAVLNQLNVRVLLQEGEVLPTGVECLSLVGRRVEADAVDATALTMEDLSVLKFDTMLAASLEEAGVSKGTVAWLMETYREVAQE